MTKQASERIPLPSANSFWGLAAILTVTGIALIIIGFAFPGDSVWRVLFHAVGGAVVGLGWVEVLHEWAVAKKIREEFLILGDFVEKGVERLCTREETALAGSNALLHTKSLRIMGIGLSWLVSGANRVRLMEMLSRNCSVKILVPDPCSGEIVDRYSNDEPPEFELGLSGLATRIRNWYNLSKKYSSLEVKVYRMYPVCTVTIYDDAVYVAPILYKRRAKDNLTIIFRTPSKGADAYEDHFDQIYSAASTKVDDTYLAELNARFPIL